MKFHIWECYQSKKISVDLTLVFKKHIKDKIKNNIYIIAKKINVRPARLYEYFIYQKSPVPLNVLISICKYFDISLNEMERNIIMYKQLYVPYKNSITKPKLPLKMSPYLTSVVSNLFFDGSVPKDGKGTYYNQKSKEIMERFIMRVNAVFGDVSYSSKRDHRGVLKCRLPRIIGEICKSAYNINSFGTFDSEVPDSIFELSNEHKLAFILSAILDEGSITYDGEILFGVCNKKLAEGVRKLCNSMSLETTIVKRKSGSKYYYFYLKSQERFYNFISKIKKIYPLFSLSYKEERLKHALKIKKLPFKYTQEFANKRRQKIIDILSKESLSVNQLSQYLFIKPRSLRRHISFLLNEKKIIRVKNSKGGHSAYFCPN